MKVTEACACGAQTTIDGVDESTVTFLLKKFRDEHTCRSIQSMDAVVSALVSGLERAQRDDAYSHSRLFSDLAGAKAAAGLDEELGEDSK